MGAVSQCMVQAGSSLIKQGGLTGPVDGRMHMQCKFAAQSMRLSYDEVT